MYYCAPNNEAAADKRRLRGASLLLQNLSKRHLQAKLYSRRTPIV
jgi:hypothetical protein